MLRCMQDLTELYLNDVLASAAGFLPSTVFRTFQKFSFPHLSRFLINALLMTVIALLSCVNIPLDTEPGWDALPNGMLPLIITSYYLRFLHTDPAFQKI